VGTALDVNPVAALGRGLGITSGGGGVADLGTQLATLIGFAVVALVVAQLIPERTGRR
jgi:ABC-2 type transport system permease protein